MIYIKTFFVIDLENLGLWESKSSFRFSGSFWFADTRGGRNESWLSSLPTWVFSSWTLLSFFWSLIDKRPEAVKSIFLLNVLQKLFQVLEDQ